MKKESKYDLNLAKLALKTHHFEFDLGPEFFALVDQPLDIEEQLLVRFGDEAKELDDNVLQITPETQTLPLAQHIYDYIGLSLPMKKLHPRFQNETDDNPDAPTKLIFSTRPTDEAPDDDEPADPRWAALRNLN